jgi:tetratricopeptide (TPR) repeat protein
MKRSVFRKILGLATGAALVAIGALEIGLSRADYENPGVQVFCGAGLCPDQFSPERVFDLGQKATLGDARGELEDFKRAVRLSPASAYRWADLAEAEFNVRDYKNAEYAISQALQAGPRSPVILTRAANLYFEIGDSGQVIRNLSSILRDPGLEEYYDSAFLTLSRLGLPVEQILSEAIPRRKTVVSRLLIFWTRINQADAAVATWKWANSLGNQGALADDESTGNFFAYLMAAGRQNQAQDLWRDYAAKSEPGYRTTNWIYNSGFESAPQLSPFDWTINQRQDIEAGRVRDVTHDGKWALRIKFNGETNTAYHQTYQDAVLEPGRYKFSVMMKSELVTTDQGLRLHLFDQPTQAKLNVWTDTVIGTRDWTKIETAFEVPVGVKVVRVEIGRLESSMFDNKIGGTTWIDELRLSRQ